MITIRISSIKKFLFFLLIIILSGSINFANAQPLGTFTFPNNPSIFPGPVTFLSTVIGAGGGTIVYNVKSPPYNAVGDGVTNDTAAIQAAITDASNNNGTVYFPNGTYHLAGAGCAMTVGKNGDSYSVALLGQNRSSTIIDATSCPTGITIFANPTPTGGAVQDFSISSLTLTCGPSNASTIGVHTLNNGTFFMYNAAINSCSQYALELESTNVQITSSTFNLINPGTGNPTGIIVISGSRGFFENIYTSGMYIGNAGDNEIKNFHVLNSLLDDHTPGAIWVDGANTHDNSINDSIIYTNTNGIGVKVGEAGHSPSRITFANDWVGPFTTGYAELWNIQIVLGTDIVFNNVITQVQNAGGDISDSGTNTIYINTNRKFLAGLNCSSSASPAVCGATSAGSFVLPAAATTVTVNTTAVTANSQVMVQEDDSLGTKLGVTCNTTINQSTPEVTARVAGTSFSITTTTAPVTNPACYSFFIVN